MSAHEHDPGLSPRGQAGTNVLPASQLLHERLQERRAKNMRPKRARHTDYGVNPTVSRGRDDDIFLSEAEESRNSRMYDSSPIVASARTSDVGVPGGDRRRRAAGVRDVDDQLDRLSKQNFALKLELDHRRAQVLKMQTQIDAMSEQVERATLLEEEHKELLRINTELVSELEKRDQAVEEALDHICDLEDHLTDLQERASNTRPSTAQADSGYAGTETHEQAPPSSPPVTAKPPKTSTAQPSSAEPSAASQRLQGLLSTQAPGKLKREPSILSSQQPSTHALRSVYMEKSKSLLPVKSFHSLLSRHDNRTDEDGEDLPSSPRLSVLSESSFPSLYSPRSAKAPNEYSWEAAVDIRDAQFAAIGSRSHMRQDSIKRVSQWISERDMIDSTPSKSSALAAPLHADTEHNLGTQHYQSLSDAFSAATVHPKALDPAADLHTSHPPLRKKNARGSQPRPASLAGPMYGESMYPPTPDSVSTRMLRDSRSTINEGRALIEPIPAGNNEFVALEPDLRTAPRQMRSSVELRCAYDSNLNFRKNALDGPHNDDGSDEEHVQPDVGIEVEPDKTTDLMMARHLDYDGFPDGRSIKLGTPSRFMSHTKPPADIMFNRNDMLPIVNPRPPRRRRSSEQIVSQPANPHLTHMKTSPSALRACKGFADGSSGGEASVESVVSPQSVHSQRSEASSSRTVLAPDEPSQHTLSPSATTLNTNISPAETSPSMSKTALSPARTLSKKMPNLFRRFSSSQGSERGGSPLPTLTSTPASAYAVNAAPRPTTSHSDRTSKDIVRTAAARLPSSRGPMRASLSTRSKPGHTTDRPASAFSTNGERRSMFRRSNSVKAATANTTSQAHIEPSAEPADQGAPGKRRGSVKEVVVSRRPWR